MDLGIGTLAVDDLAFGSLGLVQQTVPVVSYLQDPAIVLKTVDRPRVVQKTVRDISLLASTVHDPLVSRHDIWSDDPILGPIMSIGGFLALLFKDLVVNILYDYSLPSSRLTWILLRLKITA